MKTYHDRNLKKKKIVTLFEGQAKTQLHHQNDEF